MSNYNEQMLAHIWLIQQLGADSTLLSYAPGGVWRGMAPAGEATPFVIISHQSGQDSLTNFGYRVLTTMTFQVKAVGPASATTAINSAAARIDALLGSPPGRAAGGPIVVSSVQEGQMYAIYREQPFVLDEIVNGELWTNIGGLYRCQVGQVAS
jgi:hypothetical protein